ncbi:YebC/PmpR family DNA-binding transcriptional regulator [Chloroflexota bacterium]
MSGHSKWASIKHQKGVTDTRRGQLFTKLTREIIIAAREGGGNPDMNFRLRLAIQKGRDNNMPMDNIDRAIKKGTGEIEGITFTELTIEGYGPSGTAILVQALTDNRNRTVQEMRNVFSRQGGNMGESGCVAWLFDNKGVIMLSAEGKDADEVAMMAIDAGADDVKVAEDHIEIYTKMEDLETVRAALEKGKIEIASAEISMIPKTLLALDEKTGTQVLRLLNKFEEMDDVQNVYSNADIPESLLEEE